MHAGRNIVIIGALRGEFRIGFFNAALIKDPARILERQGSNTRHPDTSASPAMRRSPRAP
jgi:uncharacterized protein YdeI (YjbR/CyaY-like superfamily)